jgi:hypothetical protein
MNMRKLTILAIGVLLASLATAPVLLAHPPDPDGDGVRGKKDLCPNSDLSPDVVIDSCDADVANFLDAHGCTIMDYVNECADFAGSHEEFVDCVKDATRDLQKSGIIDNPERQRINVCAQQAGIP